MSISKILPFQDKSYDFKLDTCGLKCPLPLLKTKQTLAEISSQQVLWVISDQASFPIDIKSLARQTGDQLIFEEINGIFHFLITKK